MATTKILTFNTAEFACNVKLVLKGEITHFQKLPKNFARCYLKLDLSMTACINRN